MTTSESTLAQIVSQCIRNVVGDQKVTLHEPCFMGNEWLYVKDCLDTGWVSSVGSYVDRFEHDLASYIGVKYVVAVSNGTSGLQVALQLAGVMPGDEVLIPALSFVATANAVCHNGARPHFADIDSGTLGMSVPALGDHLSYIVERRNGFIFNKKAVDV